MKRSALFVSALLTVCSAEAHADTTKYNAFDLAAHKVGISPITGYDMSSVDGCSSLTDSGEFTLGECTPLERMNTIELTYTKAGAANKTHTLEFDVGADSGDNDAGFYLSGTDIIVKSISATDAAYFDSKTNQWQSKKILNGGSLDVKVTEVFAVGLVFYTWKGNKIARWTLKPHHSGTIVGDETGKTVGGDPFDCSTQPDQVPSDAAIVCVDTTAGNVSVRHLDSHIIKPNRPIAVIVRYFDDQNLRIEILGKRGLYEPGLRDFVPRKSEPSADAGTEPGTEPPATPRVSVHSFAPRTPGDADVRIKLVDDTGKTTLEETVELTVEKTYLGALRLGIAPIFGGAVENTYAARTHPGSGQPEIVATSNNQMDLEVVLGVSAFFGEWYKGGRAYHSGPNYRLAPYVGVGIVNAERDALEFLPSVHVGIEWELTPSFSIAVTAVGRDISRLAPGFHVGDPVMGDVPTQTGIRWGVGVVFNLSPEFLKLASESGSSFF